ncbi:hypothetical protein AQUCO_00300850v1 [Aquilegia coerulea]|uniref:SAGA-associated factor 11 n=1 Tax=Aquilegia coerulea TaxID=218851 RepID=A0A2G5F0W5_AQUCA|nr:hypothetical protein AQUCO_00300850v1 [Aquilegia coerulea]
MVCSLGRGRMAAMARLLANGSYVEMTAEEVGHKKVAAQSMHRELHEADEENLLDEEDMHVFDCKPMVDPLHLVCCNNCKKPVKASQYASHAERCRSLNYSGEIVLELDGGTGPKKPPRKGRKKSQTTHDNPAMTLADHERLRSMDGGDTAVSESVNDKTGLNSCSREAKRNSIYIGGVSVKDGSVLCSGSTDYTAVVMSPSEKRTKLIAAEHMLISEGLERTQDVSTNSGINDQKAAIYPPVPLATKMYHSQRNLRLRSALNQFYKETSTNDHSSEDPTRLQDNVMLPSQVSSPKDFFHDPESDELQKKMDAYSLSTVREPDQILSTSSELCLESLRGSNLSMDLSNQYRDNNFSRSSHSVDTAAVGKRRSRYLSTSYSFNGKSGTSLRMQQKGSVPVV